MKIIIAGGGIAGLTTFLYMKKYLCPNGEHSIKIFESHHTRIAAVSNEEGDGANLQDLSSSTALVGGGLGIAPNGMRVLRDLSEELHDSVAKQGFVCETYAFNAARGFAIASQKTTDRRDPPEHTVSSSRHGLWKCLSDAVGNDVVQFRKVTEVVLNDHGKPTVRFADGSPEEEADLVVGADGVRSNVKRAIFGDEDDKYAPKYNGLSGVGGFVDEPPPAKCIQNKSLCFTFGGNGFFGYGPASAERTLWWSTYQISEAPDRKVVDAADIYAQLKERHADWRDPVLHGIINNSGGIDSIYPTWITPSLPTWTGKRMVLVGDAAHALPPTSGQGASQALEDAQTLALLLEHYLKKEEREEQEAIELSAKAFYEIRSPRVLRIKQRSEIFDSGKINQGIVAEYGMYFFLWLMTSFPFIGRLIIGDVTKELYHWDARTEIEKLLKKQQANSAA